MSPQRRFLGNTPEERLANGVRDWRKLRGLTQIDLADKAGVSRATLIDVELAKGNPCLATLVAVARVLDIEVEGLFRK